MALAAGLLMTHDEFAPEASIVAGLVLVDGSSSRC